MIRKLKIIIKEDFYEQKNNFDDDNININVICNIMSINQ